MPDSPAPILRYTNPVFPHEAADPFVLKHCGEYWCFTTGLQPDGRAFGVLHSPDLVHWRRAGSAMDPLPGEGPNYWAPEVSYLEGVFYLYYAVGDEEQMHLRVATAEHPAGPFQDRGIRLTAQPFAIDPHVLNAGDGQRYLFYATDFLDHDRIGTGTVMDRLLDPFHLEGKPRPVTLAKYDWQVFDPARASKGGVRWHTIEGSFVLGRDGLYYQMFSGGNWQNHTYGVSYATTRRLDREGEWDQYCDGEKVLPILRTLPELGVIGPGHNSVVRGPDNQSLYCVYHRWQPESGERVLAIDLLEWEGERLLVRGPSVTPQPIHLPAVNGFGALTCLNGACRLEDNRLRLEPTRGEAAEAVQPLPGPSWVLEISLHGPETTREGAWGLRFEGPDGGGYRFTFINSPPTPALLIHSGDNLVERFEREGFRTGAFHLLRLEARAGKWELAIDDDRLQEAPRLHWMATGPAPAGRLVLFARDAPAEFCGLQITRL